MAPAAQQHRQQHDAEQEQSQNHSAEQCRNDWPAAFTTPCPQSHGSPGAPGPPPQPGPAGHNAQQQQEADQGADQGMAVRGQAEGDQRPCQ